VEKEKLSHAEVVRLIIGEVQKEVTAGDDHRESKKSRKRKHQQLSKPLLNKETSWSWWGTTGQILKWSQLQRDPKAMWKLFNTELNHQTPIPALLPRRCNTLPDIRDTATRLRKFFIKEAPDNTYRFPAPKEWERHNWEALWSKATREFGPYTVQDLNAYCTAHRQAAAGADGSTCDLIIQLPVELKQHVAAYVHQVLTQGPDDTLEWLAALDRTNLIPKGAVVEEEKHLRPITMANVIVRALLDRVRRIFDNVQEQSLGDLVGEYQFGFKKRISSKT